MQASLNDLSLSRPDSDSFLVCQRVLRECHEIIFGDLPSHAPYATLRSSLSLRREKKVKSQLQPALVGIGMILAGAPGIPEVTRVVGQVAIEQGRVDDLHEDLRSLERHDDSIARRTDSDDAIPEDAEDDEEDNPQDHDASTPTQTRPLDANEAPEATGRRLMPRRKTIGSRTTPTLPLVRADSQKARLSEDPFGQHDTTSPPPNTFQSTPALPSSGHAMKRSQSQAPDPLLAYDIPSQVYLLRGNFCRSEVRSFPKHPVFASKSTH